MSSSRGCRRSRVCASSRAPRYSPSRIDTWTCASIADTLGVAYVLEGDFQKSGSRLRVQVRLLDGRDESTRWSSETYDREFRDVFAVEDDIGGAVVRELGLRLRSASGAPPRREPTKNASRRTSSIAMATIASSSAPTAVCAPGSSCSAKPSLWIRPTPRPGPGWGACTVYGAVR